MDLYSDPGKYMGCNYSFMPKLNRVSVMFRLWWNTSHLQQWMWLLIHATMKVIRTNVQIKHFRKTTEIDNWLFVGFWSLVFFAYFCGMWSQHLQRQKLINDSYVFAGNRDMKAFLSVRMYSLRLRVCCSKHKWPNRRILYENISYAWWFS